jgi:hypothetical protein
MASRKDPKAKENQARKPVAQKAMADTSGSNLADFKKVVLNTPQRAANNLLNVVKSTPLGIAAQTAAKGAATYQNKGYKAAVTQQAKIAGLQIASEVISYGTGKALQRGVGAVVGTGLPARISNKVTGQKVLVHGTPDFEKLIGNKLMPKAGSPGSPTEKVVFGYNPQFKGSGSADYLEGSVKQYTGPKGGAIIAKFPKKSLKNLEYQESNAGLVNQMAAKGNPLDPKNPPWVLSKSPARIVAKVPVAGGDFKNQLAKELKLAGAPLRDSTREKAIERLLRERASKKYNKNNPSVV